MTTTDSPHDTHEPDETGSWCVQIFSTASADSAEAIAHTLHDRLGDDVTALCSGNDRHHVVVAETQDDPEVVAVVDEICHAHDEQAELVHRSAATSAPPRDDWAGPPDPC